jgi:subtilisin family serine protease
VAAIDKSGNLASWSNYGSTGVDLGAPGVSIWSTVPNKRSQSSYNSYSGTSMATPHVTGAVALYAAAHPNTSAAAIKGAILSTTVPTGSLSGKTVTNGRLNISAALCSPSCP